MSDGVGVLARHPGASPVSSSAWIRRVHRWVSIAFTMTVCANFVAIALGQGASRPWITYAPLPPLTMLLLTGLYLFELPYFTSRRSRHGARERESPAA